MSVLVNGSPRSDGAGCSVTEIVAALGARPDGTAVAVNDEVVPRSAWSARLLQDGDRVEVLTAVQGG